MHKKHENEMKGDVTTEWAGICQTFIFSAFRGMEGGDGGGYKKSLKSCLKISFSFLATLDLGGGRKKRRRQELLMTVEKRIEIASSSTSAPLFFCLPPPPPPPPLSLVFSKVK